MAVTRLWIRPISPADHAAWLELWAAYCTFYGVSIPPHVTDRTWQRITAAEHAVRAIVAVSSVTNEVLGFAHYVVHPYTWSEDPACYLEDLFVRPADRVAGVGRALIEYLVALAKRERWSRLYWMTQTGNATARRLYDRIGTQDDFIRYTVDIDP